ncbi:MAG: SOS response-associated peptidase family protein [Bacteriovoracaceae bacterium]|nr:SOS response-associated peptidase family protein [Bacteriovoracaceae bacterium]
MCFSVQIDKDIKRLSQRFNAHPAVGEFHALKALQEYEAQLTPQELKSSLGLKRVPKGAVFKTPESDGIVYPNYFAPVMVFENGKRVIRPMRYRVRPANSVEEIPAKYNVFNARIDALEKRQTWRDIFLRNHGLFPFKSFYEWVQDDAGKKRLINFAPNNAETMWAPCIFDQWRSKDGKIQFYSFALITDDPPQEIEDKGHDRCPIFLKQDLIDQWLQPQRSDKGDIYQILKQKETTYFESSFPDT